MNYNFTKEEFDYCKRLTEDSFCLCYILRECYKGHEDEMPMDMVLPMIRLISMFVDRVNSLFLSKE